MGSASMLDAVARLLANDDTFLSYKGLTSLSTTADKAAYIVKDEETDGVVDSTNIPITLVYVRPGKPDHRTPQVYLGKVVIDCFAGDPNTARLMAERTMQIMQNWNVDMPGAWVCRFAYDTSFKTGIVGVRGHRIFYDINYFTG